jgi:hypothetical protein
MDGIPVNRFSGTVLEQANTWIFLALCRSQERFAWAEHFYSRVQIAQQAGLRWFSPRKKAQ